MNKQSRDAFMRLSIGWRIAVVVSVLVWVGGITAAITMPDNRVQTMETHAARMVCAEVYGNERGYYNARREYNTLAKQLGRPSVAEPFRTPPSYVAAAVAQLGSCPSPI